MVQVDGPGKDVDLQRDGISAPTMADASTGHAMNVFPPQVKLDHPFHAHQGNPGLWP